jgi:hypothetical protein
MMRLLENTDAPPLQGLLRRLKRMEAADPEARLRCAACLQPVTSNNERIEVGGACEHECTNPNGFRFHIICFRGASGCRHEGIPTSMHTWFAGYDWCYALCANCRIHLGWHYANGGDCFYGLIKDRLIENPASRPGN